MQLEPLKEISWAFQLHYHICFRTHRRKTVFDDQFRIAALSQALTDLCKINDLHLIEKDLQPQHVQLILSLHPSQLISDALKRLKGRSSAAICQEFGVTPPLWARGYLARSVGRVRIQEVKGNSRVKLSITATANARFLQYFGSEQQNPRFSQPRTQASI